MTKLNEIYLDRHMGHVGLMVDSNNSYSDFYANQE